MLCRVEALVSCLTAGLLSAFGNRIGTAADLETVLRACGGVTVASAVAAVVTGWPAAGGGCTRRMQREHRRGLVAAEVAAE
jgi:hypothetical protein